MEEEQERRKKQKVDNGVQIWVKYSDYDKVMQEADPNSTIYELKHNIRNHPELLLSSFKLSQIILSSERKLEPEEEASILNSGDTVHVEIVQNESIIPSSSSSITPSASATETQKNVLIAIPRVVIGDKPVTLWWNRTKISTKQGDWIGIYPVNETNTNCYVQYNSVAVGQNFLTIPYSASIQPGRYVCRYIKASDGSQIAKSNIIVKVASPVIGTDSKKSLKELCLQSIHSNIFCFKSFSKLPGELLTELMEYLDSRGALDDNILPLFFGSNMTTLSLNYSANVSTSLADIGKHCTNLSHVKLRDFANDTVVFAIIKGCPTLQSLSFHADSVSSSAIEAIAQYCKNLRKLVLKHAGNLSTIAFKALLQVCKRLEVVKITEGFIEAACDPKILISNIPNVTELSLIDCQVEDSTLQTISTSCPKLRLLNLTGSMITAVGVKCALKCPNLHSLTLRCCFLLNDQVAQLLIDSKLQFTHINVQGCQLTDHGKKLLTDHFIPKGTKIRHSAVKIQVDKNSVFRLQELITGNYKYYYSHSRSDHLAIHPKGSTSYQSYIYLTSPVARFSFGCPRAPGEYELVLHTTTGITSERVPFRVEGEVAPIPILLEASPARVTSSDELTVRITSSNISQMLKNRPWFGIYAVGSDVSEYLNWKYLENPSSSVVFDLSGLQPGDYEVRLVDNDHVTIHTKSNTFAVA